jgi:hypothetical protein
MVNNNHPMAASKTCPARPTQHPALRSHPTPKTVPADLRVQASKVLAKMVSGALAPPSLAVLVADF